MTGRTLALIEAGVAAAVLPAADVLLQAITASGFDAIDLRQVGAAAVIGGLTYLIGFLRALPVLPQGTVMTVPLTFGMGATSLNQAPRQPAQDVGSLPVAPPDPAPHG